MSLAVPIVAWTLDGRAVIGQLDSDFRFVINLANITSLVGGTPSDLDSLSTIDVDSGIRIVMAHTASGADLEFLLVDSPGAEVVPWLIRPDNYDASTNDKGWSLRQVRKDGLICAWDKNDNTKFYRLFADLTGDSTVLLKVDSANPFTITG